MQAFTLVHYRDLGNGNLQIQLAIDGKLAPMVDEHRSSMERFQSDAQYFDDLARKCETLIHLYGDARNPLPEDEVLRRSERGFS